MKTTIWKKSLITLLLPASMLSLSAYSHDSDDPILTRVMLNQFELRDGDGSNSTVLEGQAWIGKDLNKFWLKTDVERRYGNTQDAPSQNSEIQALYSHAIAPFWDAQIGLMHSSRARDVKPTPTRDWGVIGLQGLAPYWFDIEAALFVGELGHTGARVKVEYELLFTQRLILSPELEVNVYGQNDAETGTGSGLSDVKAGLRLRYEIRREFAPYVGVNWNKTFGNTAEFVKNQGEGLSDTELVAGLRVWF